MLQLQITVVVCYPTSNYGFPFFRKLQKTFGTLREARFECCTQPKVSSVPYHVYDRDIAWQKLPLLFAGECVEVKITRDKHMSKKPAIISRLRDQAGAKM